MNVIAEKELQPSTSPRVCEVWNGRNVERRLTLWSSTNPPIKEHIVHGNEVHENKNGPFEHCRENNEKYKYKRNHGFQSEKGGNNLTDDMQYPPNLSLNLGPYSRCEKPCGVLITGLALQLSVLTFAALTTFFPLWTGEFSHDNLRSRLVFFSFTCAGTLLLSLSLWWTAYTIGKPEISRVYKPKEDSQQTFVVWAQRENDDLGTEACIIIKKIEKELISAHRNLGTFPSQNIVISYISAFFLIVGFLIQSVGLSTMHWPTQSLQLLAISAMFGLRYWLHKQTIPDGIKLQYNQDDGPKKEFNTGKAEKEVMALLPPAAPAGDIVRWISQQKREVSTGKWKSLRIWALW
ncbi:hypothetical protein KXV92_003446 [Aspergillus fumigatus]|nr:hypothetical protein KXV92_003446 [Aspergillus fumigatus]